jgi:hypothetical protein
MPKNKLAKHNDLCLEYLGLVTDHFFRVPQSGLPPMGNVLLVSSAKTTFVFASLTMGSGRKLGRNTEFMKRRPLDQRRIDGFSILPDHHPKALFATKLRNLLLCMSLPVGTPQ